MWVCVMEPESRRLMRAWRDEGVANQVLEPGVLVFRHEESSHSIKPEHLRSSS